MTPAQIDRKGRVRGLVRVGELEVSAATASFPATKVAMPMRQDPNRRGTSRRWITLAVEDSVWSVSARGEIAVLDAVSAAARRTRGAADPERPPDVALSGLAVNH